MKRIADHIEAAVPVLLADEVAMSLARRIEERHGLSPEKGDFPNIAPPWNDFLIEWRFPEGFGRWRQAAVHIQASDPNKDCPLGTRWLLVYKVFLELEGQIKVIAGNGEMPIAGDGTILGYVWNPYPDLSSDEEEWGKQMSNLNLCVALLALSFANCKNVKVAKKEIPPKLVRARERKNKPLIGYHVLDISPLAGYKAEQKAAANDGVPLHVARGHFKDYRERGLFGHHKGVYWWGPLLRGDIELGAVEKDYRVGAA